MKRAGNRPVFASHRLVPLVSFVLLCRIALAAPASTIGLTPYSVRIWQTDDGLPQNSVHAIAQTDDGFLWVGPVRWRAFHCDS
jgi:ligand-binding sensor domain-containing protein